MIWSTCSMIGLFIGLPLAVLSCGSTLAKDLPGKIDVNQLEVVKGKSLNPKLLARFKVPQHSVSSDKSPLRVEAEVVGVKKRRPNLLRAFLLVPKGLHTSSTSDPLESDEFFKVPFGKIDVYSPLRVGEEVVIFADDDVKLRRSKAEPGMWVFIGVESASVRQDGEIYKTDDVDVKVRHLLCW